MPPSPRFANKLAVVTGASTGIGFASAKALIAEGARVIITGQNEQRLATAAQQLGANAIPVIADVRKLEDLDRLAQRTRELSERVDVLFANAGLGRFAPLEHVSEAFFDEVFDTNVKGLFFTIQKLAGLLKQGSSVILNASAVHAKGAPSSSLYFATKAAVRSLARTLAAEFGSRGVRVNALSPGYIITEFQNRTGLPPEALDGFIAAVEKNTPLGRVGTVDDVIKAVLFLASDDSAYMTAADLVIDGGYMNV
ncbi:MAG TPA: SDR family oxidoreductase [Myxococcaceae bacterium]|jgi:NAD(P)-dependent dehydrogenase (short-subunit alcohol dehydrogenase family)